MPKRGRKAGKLAKSSKVEININGKITQFKHISLQQIVKYSKIKKIRQ